ncbi:MAG: hypothetical protein ACK51T_00445, partial [bacterium]
TESRSQAANRPDSPPIPRVLAGGVAPDGLSLSKTKTGPLSRAGLELPDRNGFKGQKPTRHAGFWLPFSG